MADFAASAAANAVGNLATEYASPYLSYFFHYGKIVEDFKNQRQKLQSKEDRVKNEVNVAVRQAEIIEMDVDQWMTTVEKELRDSQILEYEIDRIQCCKWCPNWGWRYSLSKKLVKKTLIISKLVETCNFSPVGRRAALQGIEFITSKDFRDSESSKSALKEIMEAVNAMHVNMIGLYGMPGVGKTTLATEFGKLALEQKLFDEVVMFTMYQNPNITKIQDKLADMFGLKFKATSEEGKAEELLRSMKGQTNILIIVDDLWEEYKLETIGIPLGFEHEGCKILLTTRDQKVCTLMNCQKQIQLGVLSEKEGWGLFKANAGLEDGYSTLNAVAKKVAGECRGLPLAIVTVAKALKGESLEGWRAANRRLKDSRHLSNENVFGSVYRALKLSYDYLEKNNNRTSENEIQLCLLLCSLFPEDYEILIEILIMCGIGVGLFSDVDSIEDKRKEIGVAVSKLQKSGLLLEADSGRRVRMHDVVRDFAHWLTSQGENRFMVKDRVKEWPNVVANFECYTAIALWNCSCLNHFPRNVKFSKLKTLFLEGKNLQSVPSTCFEEMEALQVLFLKDVSFSLEGLQSLTNLRTLCCVECKLGNLSSSLRNLRNLEILALFYTNIDEIPENLVELPSLKSLYLSHDEDGRIISFPLALWSRLSSLQELHVMSENNVNLMELNSLSDLTSLSLRVSANRYVGEDFIFPKLERYVIVFNKHLDVWQGLTFRTLEIKSLSSSLSAFKNLFHNVEILRLEQVQKLTSLPLIKSWDEEEPQLFSNLIFLNLKSLPQLESIWELQPSCHVIASFRNLKVVTIENCHKLKVIFSPCIAQSMVHLQQLCVFSCEGLEQVIGFSQEEENIEIDRLRCPSQVMEELYLDDVGKRCQLCRTDVNQDCILVGNHEEVFWVQGGDSFSSIKQVHLRNLSEVQIIWKDLAGVVTLDNLTSLKLYVCEKLKYIFSPWTARSLSRLANLYIMGCEELEEIILDKDQISSSSNVDTALQPISFPSLTQIEVTFCNNLRGLFPLGSATSLQQLKCLKVENNMKLEQVFEVEDVTTKDIEFDKLELLKLEDLPCLIGFSSKGYHFLYPGLNNLEATRCPKMTTTFSIDSKQIVHSKTEKGIEGSTSEITPVIVHEKDIRWERGRHETLPQYME
ncbi:hypothetical protein GQ457_09G023270 [Hibiscus cannabinus]